jgi:hypothetical protein
MFPAQHCRGAKGEDENVAEKTQRKRDGKARTKRTSRP